MLQVVENEQELLLRERGGERPLERDVRHGGDTESLRQRRNDELGFAERRELHDGDAVGEERAGLLGERKRKPCLAAAARAGERHEPDVGTLDEATQRLEL